MRSFDVVAVLTALATAAPVLTTPEAAEAAEPARTKKKSRATKTKKRTVSPGDKTVRPPDARPTRDPATPRPQPKVRTPVPRPTPSPDSRREPARVRPDATPSDPTRRHPTQSHSAVQRHQVRKDPPPPRGGTRSYERPKDRTPAKVTRPARSTDHRYARPHHRHVRRVRAIPKPPPTIRYYAPRYTHWWVHPYYRYERACRIVVHLPFYVHPWSSWWVPPVRHGWAWVPGYWASGYWIPGYWVPTRPAPVVASVQYVWVDGWWQGSIYVEGFWRRPHRGRDWVWVPGRYLGDSAYLRAHWRPAEPGPAGYVWEPGFYDGDVWVEGFWRPRMYNGFVWVDGYFDEDGVFHMGYWEPEADRPGFVWVPGWFDGNEWIPGYWVAEREYQSADVQSWEPPEGWNDGWDDEDEAEVEGDAPLALPAQPGDD